MNIELALFTYGGIHPQTFDAVMDEIVFAHANKHALSYSRISEDALISRSRSRVASRFLRNNPKDAVLFMLDHDIAFSPGGVVETCRKAASTHGIVGGMYSCRTFGKGHTSRLAKAQDSWTEGADELLPAEYIGGGFMAIPWKVLDKIVAAKRVKLCTMGGSEVFYDFFRPITVPTEPPYVQPTDAWAHEYLSEDWAFCRRATAAEAPLHVYAKPVLRHYGDHGYTVADGLPKKFL